MLLSELELEIPAPATDGRFLEQLASAVSQRLPDGFHPVRFAVVESDSSSWRCEIGGISGLHSDSFFPAKELFRFSNRSIQRSREFNTLLLVPTGIGAELGGHAGDACPTLAMLGAACDNLITHPNVVNASDINELPTNGLFVEGSVISRLLMGTAGLAPVRSNRVLVAVASHKDSQFINAAINSVNAARAAYGFTCSEIVLLDTPLTSRARYTNSGRAAGRVEDIAPLFDAMEQRRGTFDAVAITSVIDVPPGFHKEYFESGGKMVNPWGGVEALLTHGISFVENVPSAHAPMMENTDVAYMPIGRVDSRLAAEAVSMTFLNCVLKGLQRSPRVVTEESDLAIPGVITSSDISCMIIPDGCIGLPTLAALQQGITVIAVKENANLMRNDLTVLPWSPGQFYQVENYWEAAGVMLALKAGIDPGTVRRPLKAARVVNHISDGQIETPVGPSITRSSTDRLTDEQKKRLCRHLAEIQRTQRELGLQDRGYPRNYGGESP